MPRIVKKTANGLSIVRRLASAIRSDFASVGYDVSVTSEPVLGTKLRRVFVTSELFSFMGLMEQQEYIWRIASRVLDPSDVLFVSMIVTVDPRHFPKSKPKRAKKTVASRR
jgi:hypothetical protein